MDAIGQFLLALLISVIFVLLVGGFCFWIFLLFKKIVPYPIQSFKYKILKKPINENDFKLVYDDIRKGVSKTGFIKKVYLDSKIPNEKSKELFYIYDKISKNLKGGKK